VRATYQQGSDAVVDLVVALMSELTAQVETVATRVAAVEGENAALRATVGTNSHNSGKPPSSDGPGVKPHPQSQRVVSGRKPGGQPGHDGPTLALVDAPDAVQEYAPSQPSISSVGVRRWTRAGSCRGFAGGPSTTAW